MILTFNPTGTHIKQDPITGERVLKVRIDFTPEPTENTYSKHHLYVPITAGQTYTGDVDENGVPLDLVDYQAWRDSIPHEWITTPCLCAFFTIPENLSLANLLTELAQRMTDDDIATLDNILMLPDSGHYVSPFCYERLRITGVGITPQDEEALIADVNARFASLSVKIVKGNNPSTVEPASIDVGSAAINRTAGFTLYSTLFRTSVNKSNPANATGILTTVQVYIDQLDGANTIQFGTFEDQGSDYLYTHDGEVAGSMALGYTQYTGLSIAIASGEYLGTVCVSAVDCAIDSEPGSSGQGVWRIYGQYCDPADEGTYNSYTYYEFSLYGIGVENPDKSVYDTVSVGELVIKSMTLVKEVIDYIDVDEPLVAGAISLIQSLIDYVDLDEPLVEGIITLVSTLIDYVEAFSSVTPLLTKLFISTYDTVSTLDSLSEYLTTLNQALSDYVDISEWGNLSPPLNLSIEEKFWNWRDI